MADTTKSDWHVGQDIVLITDAYRGKVNIWPTTITKIGRTKAHYELHGHKGSFYLETGEMDGGQYSSPGRAWPSVEAYEAAKELRELWKDMVSRLPVYSRPKHITKEHIEQIKQIVWPEQTP
jgi:hypothetical protein